MPDWLIDHAERGGTLIEGIAAYRRHPWRRDLRDPHVVWSEGSSSLLYWMPAAGTIRERLCCSFRVWSIAPMSLILMSEWSMMRWLAGQGLRPPVSLGLGLARPRLSASLR